MFTKNRMKVRGIVRSFQSNPAGSALNSPWAGTVHVWTFQLDRQAPTGESADPIAVEMRGPLFEGFVRDGHDVEVVGVVVNGTLQARSAINYSTGPSVVRPKGGSLRRTAIGLGLTAVIVFGVLALVMQTGLWPVIHRFIGRGAIVQLDGCIIESHGGFLFADLLAGPPQVGQLPANVIARRYEALRRADLWFGSRVEFEVEYDGSRGWLSGYDITGVEGNCGSDGSEVSVSQTSSMVSIEQLEQFQELFPDVSKHILLNSTVLENCAVVHRDGGHLYETNLYSEPIVAARSTQVIFRPDYYYAQWYPAYLYYDDGLGGSYFIHVEGHWGWLRFESQRDRLDCFQLDIEDIQADRVMSSSLNVIDLQTCVVATTGGVLLTRDPITHDLITFATLPPVKNEYQVLRGAGARVEKGEYEEDIDIDAREFLFYEIEYEGKVGWLSDLAREDYGGDCQRVFDEAYVYASLYNFNNGVR